MSMLLDGGVKVTGAEPDGVSLAGWLRCLLIDDIDRAVGAMLVEPPCAVRFGGSLLMLGDEEINELLKDHRLSEDVVEGCQEALNVLSATLNAIEGNLHIRVGRLFPLSRGPLEWLPRIRGRRAYDFEDYGRVILVAG